MRSRSIVGQALAASLSPSDPRAHTKAAVGSNAPEELVGLGRMAAFHGIQGYVHVATKALPQVPRSEHEHLATLHKDVVLRHLRTLADLAYLEDNLRSAGIPWLVIKGPTLAEPVHGAVELRSYGDLDVLVPPAHLAHAMDALEASGSVVVDRNWTLIHQEMKGEVHLQLPSGTALDLHWHLFNDPQRRQRFPVSVDDLFARSRMVSIGERSVRTLSFTDTVVYVALHTMHSGADRLIWLKDIERLLAHEDCAPNEVVKRSRQWQAELVVVSAIRRAQLALPMPQQAQTIRSASRGYRAWISASSWAWSRSPAEEEDGGGSLGRIFARSARRTSPESFFELGRRSVAHLRSRRTGEGDPPRSFAADDPRSSLYESGGPARREGFLRAVGRASEHRITAPLPRE